MQILKRRSDAIYLTEMGAFIARRIIAALAAEVNAVRHAIPDAGHNAHRENPAAVAASLAQILRLRTKDTL